MHVDIHTSLHLYAFAQNIHTRADIIYIYIYYLFVYLFFIYLYRYTNTHANIHTHKHALADTGHEGLGPRRGNMLQAFDYLQGLLLVGVSIPCVFGGFRFRVLLCVGLSLHCSFFLGVTL